MKRDLGTLGESILASWAAARGISPQRVTFDRKGWDFLLEFPNSHSTDPDLPKDRRCSYISCLVQVKATDNGRLNCSVSMRNWQHLATHPLPAFFLVLDFAHCEVPRQAYLVPVGRSQIGEALRRIRELDSQSKNISKHKMNVICAEESKLPQPNAESFEKAICDHIGPSFEGYIQQKADIVQQIGYEASSGLLSISLSDDSLGGVSIPDYLVDLSLGLREPLAISSAELRDVRFGIPARVPKVLPGGTLEITPKSFGEVELTLRRGMTVARTRMEMFLPIMAHNLKVLLKARLFDLVTSRPQLSINFHFPGLDIQEKLCDLYDMASVALLLAKASRGEELEFFVRSEKGVLAHGPLSRPDGGIPPEAFELATVARDAWIIAKHLEIQDKVKVTVGDLIVQKKRLELFRSLLLGECGRIRISGLLDVLPSKRNALRAFVPLGTEVMLGDYRATIVISAWGTAKLAKRKGSGTRSFTLETAQRKIESTFATRRDEEPSMSLTAAVNAVAEIHDDVPCVLLTQYAS